MRQLTLNDQAEELVSKARVELREKRAVYGPKQREQLTSPADVAELLWHEEFATAATEKFIVCLLNTAHVVQTYIVHSVGGLSSSIVDVRGVYQAALLDNAAAIICAHNHPSGNPEPSRADIKISRQLQEAGEVLDIDLLDSIIVVGKTEWVSLSQRGVF
jgi:DNA repair protein RadC